MENNLSLQIEKIFAAPLSKVWESWTNPIEVAKWFGPEGVTTEVDVLNMKVGGKYRIIFTDPEGKQHICIGIYEEITPMTKLAFSWSWETEDIGEDAETLVTVEFRDQGENTEMIFRHERFSSKEARDHHQQGWGSMFPKFDRYLEL